MWLWTRPGSGGPVSHARAISGGTGLGGGERRGMGISLERGGSEYQPSGFGAAA